ncbi:MAG: di-trans,poly-cis-decaprenylcistransferase [Rickettsiales bacterium]|jgi:undecaprenyl diphosphate synthase|nr:di-trans,poly-cis-decaprenylcistransferase [Rickettsiales bacterium]
MLKLFRKKNAVEPTAEEPKIPNHIAFICDGNRRWAKERKLPPLEGHRAGIANFENLVDWFIAHGVSTISFFIFSTENWDRGKEEVDFLMSLFYNELKKNLRNAIKKNLRYKIIGGRGRLSKKLANLCDKLEEKSAEGTAGTVVFALNYGGRDEIVRAVKEHGENFDLFMDTADLPDIDMVVRTSNEQRISNFMLWKLAYAEMYFMKQHWPELVKSEKLWRDVLDEYARRNRRFGGGKEKNYAGKKKPK